MSKQRDSRIELIRIISMVLIVAFHLTLYSKVDIKTETISFNYVLHLLFGIWGKVGVTLFIFISAWFFVDVDFKSCFNNKWIKPLLLIIKTWVICVLILMIVYGLRLAEIDKKIILKEILTPFYYNGYSGNYYFITVYLILYMLVPYLNKLINSISNKDLKLLFLFLTVIVSGYNLLYENVGSHMFDFIYIYIAAAFLKKNKDNFIEKNSIALFLVSYLGIVISIVLLKVIGEVFNISKVEEVIWRLYNRPNIIITLLSFSLFYLFMRLKQFYSKPINYIAKHTIGVYLITDNILLRQESSSILFKKIFKSYNFFDEPIYIVYCVCEILLIFVACILIDAIIDLMINEKTIMKIPVIERLSNKIDNYVGK